MDFRSASTHTIKPMPGETQASAPRSILRFLPWLPLVAFAGIIGFQLLGPVPFGLANNNDFARVLGPLGLWPAPQAVDPAHPYFAYFVNDYVESGPYWDSGVPSSEWLIADFAKRIAKVVLPRGTFQLRLMGMIHAGILLLAFIIFLRALRNRSLWVQWAGGFLLVFIWTDLRYVQQFNTAYTDAGAILAFAVVFAVAVECLLVSPRWMWAVGFVLASCLMLGTKTQHVITLPFLLAFCLLAASQAHGKRDRIAWLAAPFVILGTGVWMLVKTPADYRASEAFSVPFFKLAVLSPDPKGVLADFNLPEGEFLKYVGHHAYESFVPFENNEFRKRIVSLVTLSSLGRFYWRHPDILNKVLLSDFRGPATDVDLTEGGYGHLRRADLLRGRRPFELTYWSDFRHRLFLIAPFHLVWLLGFVILWAGLCVLNPRVRLFFPIWPLALGAALIAALSFVFASLFGTIETARHLVFFHTATDLAMFSVVLSGILATEELSKRVPSQGKEAENAAPVRTRSRVRVTYALAAFACVAAGILIALLARGDRMGLTNADIDDTSSRIEYSGNWTHAVLSRAANGTTSFSNDPAARARLSFRGSEITWTYATAYNRGIASVRIDGQTVAEIDQYAPNVVWQARTRFAGLGPGKHVIEIAASGRKNAAASDRYIDLDALSVR